MAFNIKDFYFFSLSHYLGIGSVQEPSFFIVVSSPEKKMGQGIAPESIPIIKPAFGDAQSAVTVFQADHRRPQTGNISIRDDPPHLPGIVKDGILSFHRPEREFVTSREKQILIGRKVKSIFLDPLNRRRNLLKARFAGYREAHLGSMPPALAPLAPREVSPDFFFGMVLFKKG